jgi:hypothetical protein
MEYRNKIKENKYDFLYFYIFLNKYYIKRFKFTIMRIMNLFILFNFIKFYVKIKLK